jgi:hypothetical protein
MTSAGKHNTSCVLQRAEFTTEFHKQCTTFLISCT